MSSTRDAWAEDSKFQKIKEDEDYLRQKYATRDSDRPDHENPVHNLIQLDKKSLTELRKTMSLASINMSDDVLSYPCRYYYYYYPLYYPLEQFSIFNLLEVLPGELAEHVCVAGGAVRDLIMGDNKRTADYDFFIVGSDDPLTIAKQLYDFINKYIYIKNFIRTLHSITLKGSNFKIGHKYERGKVYGEVDLLYSKMSEMYQRTNLHTIQIILRSYTSPSEVVTGFDLDASGVCYWKGHIYMTHRAYYAYETMTQRVDVDRMSPSYSYRLAKYTDKGFAIKIPSQYYKKGSKNLSWAIAVVHELHSIDELSPLAQLLVMDAASKCQMSQIKKEILYKVSDYGPDYDPKNKEYGENIIILRNSKMQVTGYICWKADFVWSLKDIKIKGECLVPEMVEFMIDNPGQQGLTGSFEPIQMSWEEWSDLTCIKKFV